MVIGSLPLISPDYSPLDEPIIEPKSNETFLHQTRSLTSTRHGGKVYHIIGDQAYRVLNVPDGSAASRDGSTFRRD